tara:strand:- start:1 stop:243 length:243 start_codon:yes stop_codon:yes gene_type:complete
MAVNELDRDYLSLLHMCDGIENVMNDMKMEHESDAEKKKQVGNMVMHLEMEVLDSKWTDASKDLTRVNSVIATGRTYWKS